LQVGKDILSQVDENTVIEVIVRTAWHPNHGKEIQIKQRKAKRCKTQKLIF
jgi:hypothetical protein